MATVVLIEPCFIACPDPTGTPDQGHEYVDRLTALHGWLGSGCVALSMTSRALEILAEEDELPPWGASPLDAYVQGADIMRLFYSLAEKVRPLEDWVSIREVLVRDFSSSIDEIVASRGASHIAEYERTMSLLAAGAGKQKFDIAKGKVITDGLAGLTTVSISGQIEDLDNQDGSWQHGLPWTFAFPLDHFSSTSDLGSVLSAIDLWVDGCHVEALDLACWQLAGKQVAWAPGEFGLQCHDAFLPSAQALGFASDPGQAKKLLRACAEAVVGVRPEDSHHLRTSSSGSASTVRRGTDGATAWRRDIDYEFHLHYWAGDGGVELAKVVVHNDMTIPE